MILRTEIIRPRLRSPWGPGEPLSRVGFPATGLRKAGSVLTATALFLGLTLVLGGPAWGAAAKVRAEEDRIDGPVNPSNRLSQTGAVDFSDMGSWIWAAETFDRQTCRLWKTFDIPASNVIVRARLRITADNEYVLFLDGHELGRDADWRHVYEYDLTLVLTPGKHVLAVQAYNSYNEAGVILGLRVELEDGRLVEVRSDSSWRIVPEGVRGWERMSSAPAAWPAATVVGAFGDAPWWTTPGRINLVPPTQPLMIPFWKAGWFQITLISVCGIISLISVRLMIQVARQKNDERLLHRERARIARDIHDDLGMRVTQLVLQGEVAQRELPPGSETRAQFNRICEEAREALAAMDEILWAINPRRDTLREFATYVCRYAQGFLKTLPIQCVLDVEPEVSGVAFNLPFRRNLLLAVKEALNNAARHSQATELLLQIRRQGEGVTVVVEDNGRGFNPALANPERNGLTNMAQRMREVGGVCRLTSQPGKGCRVEFSIPSTHMPWRSGWWRPGPREADRPVLETRPLHISPTVPSVTQPKN